VVCEVWYERGEKRGLCGSDDGDVRVEGVKEKWREE
jgi:hypothetical protein